MTRISPPLKTFFFVCGSLLFILVNFVAQTPRPSPSPTPSASPSVSPTQSPSPSPSPTPTPLPGAQNFHQWGSITVFNGLPSDSVRAIAQTPDGVMWFGTDNGLARFDGRRVQRISIGDSDATNSILALRYDEKGGLLVGTRAGAFFSYYHEQTFRLVAGTDSYAITTIFVHARIYFGTDAGLVLAYGGSAEPLFSDAVRREDGSAARITSLVSNGSGGILIATSGSGVFSYSDATVTRFATSPRPLFVNSLIRSPSGAVWLGADAPRGASGLSVISSQSRPERIASPTGNVLALEADEIGAWAGTERDGLFHFVGSKLKKNYTFENTSGGLRSNNILTLFTDREGVLWVGTNRGVSRFDRLGATQETVSGIPNSNFIRSLYRAPDGRLYAGSNRGLFVKNGDAWDQVQAHGNQPVYRIMQDRTGKLVVETSVATQRTFAAPDGDVWIAGDKGVERERNGHRETILEAEDVRDVYVDDDGVWAATTTSGLLHARHDPRFGWVVARIGFEQGMPSEKAFAILPADEGLLIGTNRGIVTYKPGRVPPKLITTRVISQRVHDLNELDPIIELDYPQNSLLVEVAGQSSRTFPEEFQYAFVLTNSTGDEVDRRISNDPQYAPADLSPGEYTIESVAFNRDLLPSEPLTIRFSVASAPFPWTATALAVLLAIALAGLAWAVIEHRRIAQRNRELAAARLDLANEAERERRRIARDLHDQTLADLRNLMIRSDKLIPENREFRNEIEAVSTEIRRICEDLSPSVLENVGLVAALEFLLDRTVENRKFHADESVEERIAFPLNVQLQIYRIAQEVLTNIVRHSDADLVEMYVELREGPEFALTIRDNGSSFHPDESIGKGRGISNIRARANLINGRVAWKGSRGGGNVFSLRVVGSMKRESLDG